MREQITSGTAKECLNDFFQRFGKTKELWKFAQVGSRAEGRWRINGLIPRGETMLRVYYFLELVGYKVKELEEMSPELYNVGKCICFGVLSLKSVNDELGLCDRFLTNCFMSGHKVSEGNAVVLNTISGRHLTAVEKKVIEKRQEFNRILVSIEPLTPTNIVVEGDIIDEFSNACARVHEVGTKLLQGDSRVRFEMRRRMARDGQTNGKESSLHLTWETLNNLLSEKGKQ